jgi:hypothetical protein
MEDADPDCEKAEGRRRDVAGKNPPRLRRHAPVSIRAGCLLRDREELRPDLHRNVNMGLPISSPRKRPRDRERHDVQVDLEEA